MIDLTDAWDYITKVSQERLSLNSGFSNHQFKFGEGIEYLGAAGELAARRFFHLPENLGRGLDGGFDFVWRGWRVDVKSTRADRQLENCFLQWPIKKQIRTDIILMARVDLETHRAEMVGWCWWDKLKDAPVNMGRNQPCHEYPVVQLNNPWSLFVVDENLPQRHP